MLCGFEVEVGLVGVEDVFEDCCVEVVVVVGDCGVYVLYCYE